MSVAIRVIPCLDVSEGRVVKGVNFVDLVDAGDPVELARRYDEEGADELTFLDITATSDNRRSAYEMIRRTAEQVFIPLTVGGGVRTTDDIDALLRAGRGQGVGQLGRRRAAGVPVRGRQQVRFAVRGHRDRRTPRARRDRG